MKTIYNTHKRQQKWLNTKINTPGDKRKTNGKFPREIQLTSDVKIRAKGTDRTRVNRKDQQLFEGFGMKDDTQRKK